MKTVASPIQVFNRREPIPGYVLRERIGEGGFGEVWKSDAPGGLLKAVKIVYGPINARKAERELKALNRIKQVQHPMLLSLERIEVIDGHLVIVTELADRSLNDRFLERRDEGHPGIPREELLGYLSDAADALDYLYTQHSLQHLDVKPENLLLLAGRVKVADFGMVKDLHEPSETLVAGMTPLYAPPEIYDGKPNRHSDQYSLAIVFQYMLTGEPAFSGRTAAQLASQHLHTEPSLAPLASNDRSVVARALSKDPARRFDSCGEFVAALKTSKPQARTVAPRRRSQTTLREPPAERQQHSGSTTITCAVATDYPCPTALQTLAPLSNPQTDCELVPTLFVGIGTLAGQTLRYLRQRLSTQIGLRDEIPALQFLLIDTDVNNLTAATRGPADFSLRMNETVAIPIRDPAHYRENSDSVLEWLERRWLYNIPRSLKTEGIRPLGRLAFVDGFPAVADALRRSIANAVDPAFMEQTSQATGRLVAEKKIQVFVLASTTGGTSSGMVLDLPYAIRTILREQHLPDDRLNGILMHATGNRGRSVDLQLASTIACLRELVCYSTHGSKYPGEPACGIPSFTAAPFAHTYLLELGDRLTTREFERKASMVAHFLFANSASPATGTFWQLRGSELYAQSDQDDCRVRTFSAVEVTGDSAGDRAATEYLCWLLVKRWLGDENREQLNLPEIESLAAKFIAGLDLSTESLKLQAERLTQRGVVIDDPESYIHHVVDNVLQSVAGLAEETSAQAAEEWLDELLAGHAGDSSLLLSGQSWQQVATEKLAGNVEQRVGAFLDWFAMLAKQPKIRLRGVQHAVHCVVSQLDEIERTLTEFSEQRAQEQVRAAGLGAEQLHAYGMIRLQQLADRSVLGYLRTVVVQLQEYSIRLHELCRRLDEFARQFSVDPAAEAKPPEVSLIASRRWQFLVEFEDALNETAIETDALSELAHSSRKDWVKLASSLRQIAGRIVASATAKHRVASLVSKGPQDTSSELDELLEKARPPLRKCGGKERLVVLLPETAQSDTMLSLLMEQADLRQATTVHTTGDCITIFNEISDVPVRNIVSKLAGGRPQCFELADRLQSRVDVEWEEGSAGS